MHHYEHFWLDPKFWVGVSFVIFLLLVGRKAWGQMTGMLDARAEKVRAERPRPRGCARKRRPC
ncbi:hypothetical protein [Dankookia sp. P2]|uniref:hypothetical protein n=1 Tax=Dankookia sp. P2 TaxID=3423955 RepID=UPI003D67E4BD